MAFNYKVTDGYPWSHCTATNNALAIYGHLHSWGMTDAAAAGILGNMDWESFLNPGQMEIGKGGSLSYGYGLVQWTPGTKIYNGHESNWYDGNYQMSYLASDIRSSWGMAMPYTVDEFFQLDDPALAASVFCKNFERGTWRNERKEYANYWYKFITQEDPPEPTPEPPGPPGPTPIPTGKEWLRGAYRDVIRRLIIHE